MNKDQINDSFKQLKESIVSLDPVAFVEKYLTMDGKEFRLTNNGYKPFCDIYRYIGIKALEPNSKPVVMVKGRQVGGTTMASALEMYFMGCNAFGVNGKPPIRIIHAFPQLDMAAAYTKTKLNAMISNSVSSGKAELGSKKKVKSHMENLLDTSNPSNDSLQYKQFINGNHIWIESTGLDGSRLRGRSADVIFFDELQGMSATAITNSGKMLAQAKYGKNTKGVQVLFGTPLRQGSDFYKIWKSSTQQFYHLGCENCKKYFPLYTPGSDDWEKVWIHGKIVQCTHCNHQQTKDEASERGKWIAMVPDEDAQYIGFHINQLYMPNFTKEDIIAEKPGIHPINTERAYRNEVLGEFFQGDSSPITVEEIRDNCGDVGRRGRAQILPSDEEMVVMGIDYGAKSDLDQMANPEKNKSGQSYTCAVIMVVKGPQLLSIEKAIKFKKNDMDSKKSLIDQLMRQYSVQLTVGDIGFSNDFSTMLHTMYGDKYLVSRAQGKVNNHMIYNQKAFPKELQFEKATYYAEVFEKLKRGEIRFPFGDYDRIDWLVTHCANMEIKPVLSRTGDPSINYIKSGANDGFCALVNAYIAYKFMITSGFSQIANAAYGKDFTMNEAPLAILGNLPRMARF